MDFQLYQAVRETRRLAADRDGTGWSDLRSALDDVADVLGSDTDDAAFDRAADRLERTHLHDSPRDHVTGRRKNDQTTPMDTVAALYALYDDPTDERAQQAAVAVRRLHESLQ